MAGQADPAHRRLALLIATSDYSDPALRQLRAPGRGASDLAEVLGTPRIGGFAVQTLINARCGVLLEAIEEFCADRRLDDQLLIYLSCHGVLDDRGRLYYAATDTRRQRTAATAVAAAWLNERLEDCRARSQIVILDCCHSGAFASGFKGPPDLALEQRFRPHGRGRVVLTASRGTEYSFEGDQLSGQGVQSVFTQAIVDGLRTGDADRDKDGLITVIDIYHHVYEKVRAAEPRQIPELWTYGAEGDVLLAYSVRGAVIEPVPLPEDLRFTLESPRPRVRETAVAELAELLDAGRPGLALSARQALQQINDEDIPRVAAIARVALEASERTAAREVGRELAERDQREQARREAEEAARQQAEDQARREAEEAARQQAEDQARRAPTAHESSTAPQSTTPATPTAARPPIRRGAVFAGTVIALLAGVADLIAQILAHNSGVDFFLDLAFSVVAVVVALTALMQIHRLVIIGFLQGMWWLAVPSLAASIVILAHLSVTTGRPLAALLIGFTSDALGVIAAILLMVSWSLVADRRRAPRIRVLPVMLLGAVGFNRIAALIFDVAAVRGIHSFYSLYYYILGSAGVLVVLAVTWYAMSLRARALGSALVLGWVTVAAFGVTYWMLYWSSATGVERLCLVLQCVLLVAVVVLTIIYVHGPSELESSAN